MAGAVGLTPAHLLLREATRDAHEAAESTAGMRLLLAGELDESGYAGMLRAQLALFREWETARRDWLAALTLWRYVSRASSIEADLSDLCRSLSSDCGSRFIGDRRDSGVSSVVSRQIAAETAPTEAACWGELYVIEGSALGGRVIVRRLRELYPGLPHHFYAIGENAPSSWRRFQSLLDEALPDEASQEAAVHGAQRMFARFQQTLKDPAAHD